MNNNDLASILLLVENKFGRGSASNWKNRDFEDLNFEIHKKTKTTISVHTLKRLFGKIKTDEYYLPQKATIKALKSYVNFEKSEPVQVVETIEKIENQFISKNNRSRKKTVLFLTLSLLVLIGLFLFFRRNSIESAEARIGYVKLISTEGTLPKSAQFEYTTPNDKDSFSICYDGNFEPTPVPNGAKRKSTYYYQYPGLFRIRLWTKKTIITESEPVYVESDGWKAFGFYNHQGPLDRMFPISIPMNSREGIFSPTKKDISNSGMDTLKLVDVRIDNYYPTNVNGDDFILQTRFKNPEEWPGSRCNSVFLSIVGKQEFIYLNFANPGCSYWIHCRLSEKKMDKRNDNLTGFAFNLSEWQDVRVENRNKKIAVYINNILRYSNSYTKSIGEILGVTIQFQGNGYLKSYSLTDLNKKPIFTFPE